MLLITELFWPPVQCPHSTELETETQWCRHTHKSTAELGWGLKHLDIYCLILSGVLPWLSVILVSLLCCFLFVCFLSFIVFITCHVIDLFLWIPACSFVRGGFGLFNLITTCTPSVTTGCTPISSIGSSRWYQHNQSPLSKVLPLVTLPAANGQEEMGPPMSAPLRVFSVPWGVDQPLSPWHVSSQVTAFVSP